MGRREFYAWVQQLNDESQARDDTDSWQVADQTDHWKQMRDKRDKWRGR